MALLCELVSTVILLASKPFSLLKLSCSFGVRSICIIVQTWIELLRAAIYFHLILIWKLTDWAIAILTLPMRIMTALRRERELEINLHEMQTELENLAWDRKKLREQLQVAIKEHRMIQVLLAELEDEHDEAVVKIELLEKELQDLKEENRQLKEAQGKLHWDQRDQGDDGHIKDAERYGASQQQHIDEKAGVSRREVKNKDVRKEVKHQIDMSGGVKVESNHQYTPATVSRHRDVLYQSREVALSRSIFSAVLSLLVGIIVWEAEDPCTPLVVALFTVVGMSLKSVVEFFSTIRNKPATDAVALLSFNWFILGTLTYPMLPRVARLLAPLALKVSEGALRSVGLTL